MIFKELKSRYDRAAAAVDRTYSWFTNAQEWNTNGGGQYPITETHMRGGRAVSLFDPEGNFVSTHSSRTVTHLRDAEGNLGLRYRQSRPPEGYKTVKGGVIVEL